MIRILHPVRNIETCRKMDGLYNRAGILERQYFRGAGQAEQNGISRQSPEVSGKRGDVCYER
jgi:hypothetical protein